MKRNHIIPAMLAMALFFAYALPAAAVNELSPMYQDFFQMETEPVPGPSISGLDFAMRWETPPLNPVSGETGNAWDAAGSGNRPRFSGDFTMIAPAILTENDLGGGVSISLKADGTVNRFSFYNDRRNAMDLTLYHFDVRTAGAGLTVSRDFDARSIGFRHKPEFLSGRGLDGVAEYRLISNPVDTVHYLSLTGAKDFSGVSTSLGFSYVKSDFESNFGIIAGARYSLNPDATVFALYNGADPVKHLYNNHLLEMIQGVIGIYCSGCDSASMNAGVSYRIGRNTQLNIYGFDMMDLAVAAGSITYVVSE